MPLAVCFYSWPVTVTKADVVQMSVAAGVNNEASRPVVGPLVASAEWPVRSGLIPPLADRFSTRPETGPDLAMALGRGPVIALTPRSRRVGAGSSYDWLRCTGKTQLAAFYAESQWRARSVDVMVWIDASSKASILSGYVEAARSITGTRLPGTAESVAASFLGWLGQTDRRWLVVLDDVPDLETLDGLRPAGAGQVIITTANTQAVVGLRDLMVLEIGSFSRREAMSYLVGRLSGDPDQRRGAIDLIEDLDCHPLALAQATAAIGTSWRTCVDYREQFQRRLTVFNSSAANPLPAAGVTWTLSVDHADQLLPGGFAQSCLAIAAMLDAHGVPASVFATRAACNYIAGSTASPGQAAERARTALVVLEQAGLVNIDRGTEPPIVRMSPILQRAVQVAMSPTMVGQSALAAADALLESWPDSERGTWLGQSLRSSAASLRRATGGLLWKNGLHPLLLRAGRSLDDASLTGPAVEYWAQLTATSDQVFGQGHPESMVAVERLASSYVAAGRLAEAVTWYQRMMTEWGQAFGPDHPRTLAARVRLGRVLMTAAMYADAISILKAALSDAERAYGSGHPECVLIRDEVAAGHRAAGELGEAIRLYRLILGERERSVGSQHPDTMTTRQMLAEAYVADGRTKEAFSQYKKAVADLRDGQGADHPDTLRARGAMAAAYHQAGRMAQAVQQYEQVHAALSRVLGPDHPDTLAVALGLGRAYYAVGRLTDAGTILTDTVARGERVLAPADPLTRSALESLAVIVGG
jgi:tetratricopeptide (TPR) repeat protein